MELIHIIIDRIDKTVVYNIVEKFPQKYTHIKSIIDDDLINEYLHEMMRFSKIINSVDSSKTKLPNIHLEMKQMGEAIYRQLIPKEVQLYLKMKGGGSLFFHIDESLGMIPWELLHDGTSFLSDKFHIGRNINGQWRPHEFQKFDRLKILIVTDPAENLEWARIEGEKLYENLIAEVSPDRIDLQYLAGRRVTKLRLLNAIEDRNVIHYAGHVFHDHENPQESGWVLGNNKILRAREIKNSGTAPLLVFSNSCLSSPLTKSKTDEGKQLTDLASAFLYTGIGNYIGTNWEIKDNQVSSEFALKFYKEIFDEKSVGAALYEAKKNILKEEHHDLSWANYVLHGNPNTIIYNSNHRRSFDASRLPGYIEKVVNSHPLPIARSYENFLLLSQSSNVDILLTLKSLCQVLENTLVLAGAIVFSRLDIVGSSHRIDSVKSVNIVEWNHYLFEGVELLMSESGSEFLKRFFDALLVHQDSINKLLHWYELIQKNGPEVKTEGVSYLIGFQFYLDNLLSDLFLPNSDFLLYPKNDETILIMNGNQIQSFSGADFNYIKDGIEDHVYSFMNEICYLQKKDNILFSLHPYIQYNQESGEIHWPDLNLSRLTI